MLLSSKEERFALGAQPSIFHIGRNSKLASSDDWSSMNRKAHNVQWFEIKHTKSSYNLYSIREEKIWKRTPIASKHDRVKVND